MWHWKVTGDRALAKLTLIIKPWAKELILQWNSSTKKLGGSRREEKHSQNCSFKAGSSPTHWNPPPRCWFCAKTFARFQNDGPGACNLSVGAYPEVAQPHKAARSYPWGVSAIFENWESPELSVIAVAMAAFAVEPQAPTLGEWKAAFPHWYCDPRRRPGSGQNWTAVVIMLLSASFSRGGGALGSPLKFLLSPLLESSPPWRFQSGYRKVRALGRLRKWPSNVDWAV